ncbi:unnamed protein product [Ceratitis capitata]|uniref:(Mediterranean fruit fly) hypothetical protein n=1 Tax=Ceratitis capitata TaxID=7213 RepID=A0A811U2B6_CERCA|nr:unnamed protein product [Ceratitis capitata]
MVQNGISNVLSEWYSAPLMGRPPLWKNYQSEGHENNNNGSNKVPHTNKTNGNNNFHATFKSFWSFVRQATAKMTPTPRAVQTSASYKCEPKSGSNTHSNNTNNN